MLPSQERDEEHFDVATVKVLGEIENENFEQRRPIVHRGAAAEAGDALETDSIEPVSIERDFDGVDGVAKTASRVDGEIGGGIAQLAAELGGE